MADENPDAPKEEKPKSAGPLGGIKGWIIVIGITLLQAAFWIVMMIIREPGAAPEQAEQAQVYREDPAILQSRVEIQNFSATVPGPGGDPRAMNFNMVLEMHYLPEEKRAGAVRPTPAQIEVFRAVVVQLESKIRDHMNTFLTGQSYTNLMGERGPELVKAEMMRFVNNELERYDFDSLQIPAEISRRRVTNVLLPSWVMT
jgi:flagellar basal body-associated protein FliL